MKLNIFLAIFFLVFLNSCEDEKNVALEPEKVMTEQDSIKEYQGNLITAGKEAVFKGDQFIYQLKKDSLSQVLLDSLENYKAKNNNIFPIEIEGKVIENPVQNAYSEAIEIKKIIRISAEKKAEDTLSEK